MSKLTQGTEVYFIDPDDDSVVKITKLTNFNPGGSPADQIEDTDLDASVKTYKKGLRTPGQATATIFADPTEASHLRLHELSEDDTDQTIKFVIGWSDGTTAPTVDSAGDWVLASTRTWFEFDGYVADFPLDFATNTVVQTSLSIQRSGGSTWTEKA